MTADRCRVLLDRSSERLVPENTPNRTKHRGAKRLSNLKLEYEMVRRLYVRIVGVLMKPRLARGDWLVCALNFHFNCDQNLLLIGERESVKGPSSRHPKNRN